MYSPILSNFDDVVSLSLGFVLLCYAGEHTLVGPKKDCDQVVIWYDCFLFVRMSSIDARRDC